MLSKAQELARLGLFDELADLCQDYDCCTVSEIFDLAALLKSTGMYQLAEGLYEKALHLDPSLEWQIEANVASMLSVLVNMRLLFVNIRELLSGMRSRSR